MTGSDFISVISHEETGPQAKGNLALTEAVISAKFMICYVLVLR